MSNRASSPMAGPDGGHRVSEAIVTAVADAENVSPLDLRPLATVVDPDALNELVDSMVRSPSDPEGTVRFSYSGYAVTVTEDRNVSVRAVDGGDPSEYRIS